MIRATQSLLTEKKAELAGRLALKPGTGFGRKTDCRLLADAFGRFAFLLQKKECRMPNFIIKFRDVSVQPGGDDPAPVRRAVGFVGIDQIIPLLDSKILAPNPRAAKRNDIVEGILGSLQQNAELFKFKSKGILISSHRVEELERRRFKVEISKPFVDGTLDGGHNLLALGLHLLSAAMIDEDGSPTSEWRRIRNWESFDEAWKKYGNEVSDLASGGTFDIDVAVELLFPSANDADTMAAFDDASFLISQARNANTEVSDEAFHNKLGFYEVLQEALPEKLSRRIEWKPGVVEEHGAKPIKVRDVIALAWIPLNVANENSLLPIDISVTPQNIYRNKGECSQKFGELMMNSAVTQPIGGKAGGKRQLINDAVESALRIAADLPRIMDDIYEAFPTLYNENGKRDFGRRKVVQMYNPKKIRENKALNRSIDGYTATKPTTPFFGESTPRMVHKYPDAFLYPIMTAVSAFMTVKNGRVVWSVEDPRTAILEKLKVVAPLAEIVLDSGDWDPQKVAKAGTSHSTMKKFMEVM
jgi:hypothetical protein